MVKRALKNTALIVRSVIEMVGELRYSGEKAFLRFLKQSWNGTPIKVTKEYNLIVDDYVYTITQGD